MYDWIAISEVKPEVEHIVQVKGDFIGKDYSFIDSNGVWSVVGVTHWREINPVGDMLDDLDKLEEKFKP